LILKPFDALVSLKNINEHLMLFTALMQVCCQMHCYLWVHDYPIINLQYLHWSLIVSIG